LHRSAQHAERDLIWFFERCGKKGFPVRCPKEDGKN
jgi:hypothetical protein